MNSVRVLNASYEELSPTSLSRAVSMVLDRKAVVDDSDENRVVSSVSGVSLPYPKSIRLTHYVKVPFAYVERSWSKSGVLLRDNYTCAYCGSTSEPMTVDHIRSKSMMKAMSLNPDTWENTICACQPCNSLKGDLTPAEADMPLLFYPTVPTVFRMRGHKSMVK